MNIEDLAQPIDPKKSAEIDRRIVEGALKRAGLDAAAGRQRHEIQKQEPVRDYGETARKKLVDDARHSGIAEGMTLAVQILEQFGVDDGMQRLKTFVANLKESPQP